MDRNPLSRREFLRLAALGVGGLYLRPLSRLVSLPDFPQGDLLGRVAQGSMEIKARPNPDSQTITTIYEDTIVPWVKEVTGEAPSYIFNNQRWVETDQGYAYAPLLQPVRNLPNQPVKTLRETSIGPGLWVEVTVPYVDVILPNEPSSNSWVEAKIEDGLPVRLYYGQVFWIDKIRTTPEGEVQYRVNPNYYGGVDMLWAAAEAFRPLTEADISPITPDVTDKRVSIDVTHQTLSCYEGKSEVYFCRVSTGAKFDMFGNIVDNWATPLGDHVVTRKYISLQMSGGTTGAGYDLPGIGWSSIFATGGVAIHSTFWHNNFGDTMSHGCVNVTPEDAKWVFRWVLPVVPYDPGMVDITVTGEASTPVEVYET
jgi:lipoprotein-anchoring transpeptidase ErfK/SrfK